MTESGAGAAVALLIAGVALFLTVLFQVLGAMLDRAGPIRVRHWAEEAGGRLENLYAEPARFEAFRYLLSLLAKALPIGLAFAVAVATHRLGNGQADSYRVSNLAWGGGVALAVLVGAELFNRALVGGSAETVLRRLTPTYRFARWLLNPLILAISPLVDSATEENGEPYEPDDEASEGEIEAFLDVGAREGILEPGEEDMILRVMDFGDAVVRSVMTPRMDMICAPVEADLDQLAELLIESSHSRIPLFKGTVDEVRGVLHIRDVLAALRTDDDTPARSLVREAFVVPETKPLDELLQEMQAGHHQLAIVVDEYGGVAGLATVEDLLEEIVGEIVDEYDEDEVAAKQLEDGSWRLEGMTPLDEIEDLFDVELEEEPYETVGGLIFGYLGDVPDVGAAIEAHGLRFVVERLVGRRVDRVRIEWLSAPAESDQERKSS